MRERAEGKGNCEDEQERKNLQDIRQSLQSEVDDLKAHVLAQVAEREAQVRGRQIGAILQERAILGDILETTRELKAALTQLLPRGPPPATPPAIIGKMIKKWQSKHPSAEVKAMPSRAAFYGTAINIGHQVPVQIQAMVQYFATACPDFFVQPVLSSRSPLPGGWAIAIGSYVVLPLKEDNDDKDDKDDNDDNDDNDALDRDALDFDHNWDEVVVDPDRFSTLGDKTYDRDTHQEITNKDGRLELGIEDEVIAAFGQHLMDSNPDMPAQPPDMPPLTKCGVCDRVYKTSVTIPAATAADGSTTRWCRRCVDTWDVDCSGGSSSLNFLLGLRT